MVFGLVVATVYGTAVALMFGIPAVLSSIVVAALFAPRLADGDDTVGWHTGVSVTLGSFVLSVLLFALSAGIPLLFNDVLDGPTGLSETVGAMAGIFIAGLFVGGILFVVPALALGALTGLLYLKLRPSISPGAV